MAKPRIGRRSRASTGQRRNDFEPVAGAFLAQSAVGEVSPQLVGLEQSFQQLVAAIDAYSPVSPPDELTIDRARSLGEPSGKQRRSLYEKLHALHKEIADLSLTIASNKKTNRRFQELRDKLGK